MEEYAMKIEKIYETLLDNSPTWEGVIQHTPFDFKFELLHENNIYGNVIVYGEQFSITITQIGNNETFIGFNDFEVMNQVQYLLPLLQKLYDNQDTLKVEYHTYFRNSRYGITLKQY